ncbi:type I polyketide synthase [Actinokineospora sp. G85]|uniref:type I polyketide synthase n=1 Tax=Actinokineospora sp. G85 TaxID=3406626 RepID=UPI003C73D5C7
MALRGLLDAADHRPGRADRALGRRRRRPAARRGRGRADRGGRGGRRGDRAGPDRCGVAAGAGRVARRARGLKWTGAHGRAAARGRVPGVVRDLGRGRGRPGRAAQPRAGRRVGPGPGRRAGAPRPLGRAGRPRRGVRRAGAGVGAGRAGGPGRAPAGRGVRAQAGPIRGARRGVVAIGDRAGHRGTGGLGGHVARWAAAHGAERLVLTSRRGGSAGDSAGDYADLGVPVSVVACDVSDRDAVAGLLAGIDDLTAVVHTAGVLDFAPLADVDTEHLAGLFAGKAAGADHLDELTGDLDAFIVFSSVAGIWGSGGQAGYAAANAHLDALAQRRRASGRRATALAWGPWADGGMVDADTAARLSRLGLTPMAADRAVTALASAADQVVADVDWATLAGVLASSRPQPQLGDLAPAPELPPAPVQEIDTAGLLDVVSAEVATVLGLGSAAAVEPDRAFRDRGFDSLMAVELRDRLTARLGVRLSSTVVFDHPNPAALADFLAETLGGPSTTTQTAATAAAEDDDPVVIVGMACRYPGGVDSPAALWDLVAQGAEGVTGFPDDRGWDLDGLYDPDPATPGTSYVRDGGFLAGATDFDADFFGIAPREALAMDPQQRLLLETSWEALERAGIDPSGLRGVRGGVYVGMAASGYDIAAAAATTVPEGVEGYLLTGNTASVASGRIAYTLGLEGPAVTVETACSSSLVALHWAQQALRSGECSMALVGGVAVMAVPTTFVQFSRQNGLSPDGRCRSFDAAADGTGWAEGVGVLVVERLSDARRQGHRVLAVVKGSAINQDGASNGLTAPNGPAQQRVIRSALAAAGLTAADVDAVEAHGTGTTLGDPIEAQALLATYGQDRSEPLYLGSLKSNIGHAQAAAGVGGVIKMVEAMRRGVLPRSLHLDQPTPEVDWEAGAVQLLGQAREWPPVDRPRRAGVSSFGISGTNAHVILEQAPEEDPAEPGAAGPWVLSARTAEALRAQARDLLAVEADDANIAFTLASARARFEHRAVVAGGDPRAALAALVDGLPAPNLVVGEAPGARRAVFVFPGQGAQWVGMGLDLARESEVFAARLAECAAELGEFVQWDLMDVLGDAAALERVDVVQPALWAVMVSLAALWESRGVVPAAVVGHSQGEIAAACAAGALSLRDGARVVALRSRLIAATLAGNGGMVSVPLPVDEVRGLILPWSHEVGVAAVNGPSSTVVSGAPEALAEILRRCEVEGIRAKRVPVDYASHSEQVEALEADLLAALDGVEPRAGRVPVHSTVTGEVLTGAEMDAAYWYRNLRRTVLFDDVVAALDGVLFIEVSPHPVLVSAMADRAVAVGTLRRDQGTAERFALSAGEAFTRGVAVDWAGWGSGRAVDLPTYPFQRQRFWWDAPKAAAASGVDDRFWDLVTSGDVAGLAGTLAVEDQEPLAAVLPVLSSWHRRRTERSTADSWRYGITWRPLPEPSGTPLGTWLVVLPAGFEDHPVVSRVLDAFAERGPVRTLVLGDQECDRALIVPRLSAVDGVVSLLAFAERDHADHPGLPAGLAALVALAQALGDTGSTAPLWCVTQDAVAAVDGDAVTAPAQAQTWGLGRVIGLEHSDRWGGLVDLPATVTDADTDRLLAAIADAGEDQVALRDRALGRRMSRVPTGDGTTAEWTAHGTVLITGGTGGLGPHIARWVADRGADHLVLTSRRGAEAPGTAELAAELAERGVTVEVVRCDMADRDSVAALVDGLSTPVTAVVHAAAYIALESLARTTVAEVAKVVGAKVLGATHLDELLAGHPVETFVFFSSIAAMWGSGEHGAYGAANAHLDALAHNRRARGLPATSIAWGVWDAVNETDPDDIEWRAVLNKRLRRQGLPAMDPAKALLGMRHALAADDTYVAVAEIAWDNFATVFTSVRPSPLLSELPDALAVTARNAAEAAARRSADRAETADLGQRLAGLDALARRALLLDLVRAQVAAILGHTSPDSVQTARGLLDIGFDSITAVELRNRLGAAAGRKLPATLIFDYPTVEAIAEHLDEQFPSTAPAGSLLDQLVGLETAVSDMSTAAETERTAVAQRLEAMLALVRGGDPDADLTDASADELFDIIRTEFGKS